MDPGGLQGVQKEAKSASNAPADSETEIVTEGKQPTGFSPL